MFKHKWNWGFSEYPVVNVFMMIELLRSSPTSKSIETIIKTHTFIYMFGVFLNLLLWLQVVKHRKAIKRM